MWGYTLIQPRRTNPMSLAARFKARRLELGMTQVEVANSAGVSQQSIESIESG